MEMRRARLRAEYIGRINRVMDYIEQHLGSELTLEGLARVASFSRFHFHRIFSALVGESLYSFIQRVRLERAAVMLVSNPAASVTEIALDCGFSSSATFARAFKEAFGMSASAWREAGYTAHSKKSKSMSKEGQSFGNLRKEIEVEIRHLGDATHNPEWRMAMFETPEKQRTVLTADVEVKNLPELNVAYVRHVGPYAGDEGLFDRLYGKLMAWAGPRELIRFPETRCLCVYHDDPHITEEKKLRVSVCMTVPKGTPVDGEIGHMTVPGGKFAVARFEIDPSLYGAAWDALMGGWMPESGYQPDDRLCYELGLNDPKQHPEGKHIVDICVPVKPL